MNSSRLEEILERFPQVKIAVLGDFFLDLYLHLDRSLSEFSLETHKEAFQAVDLRGQPGAAGVVTNNLTALGAQASAVGFIGDDGNGYTLQQALESRKTKTDYLVQAKGSFTPTYIKPVMLEMDGYQNELNRIDIINRCEKPQTLNLALAEKVRQAIQTHDAILVVEQVKYDGFGTMSKIIRDLLAELSRNYPEKHIIVDSRHFAANYANVSLKMNLSEAQNAAKSLNTVINPTKAHNTVTSIEAYAKAFSLMNKQPVMITLGEQGICGVADQQFFHHPGFHSEGEIDIVGAGDSVLAGVGVAYCAGATPQEAAYIGNLVGSITIQQIGTTGTATVNDLRQRHKEYQDQLNE